MENRTIVPRSFRGLCSWCKDPTNPQARQTYLLAHGNLSLCRISSLLSLVIPPNRRSPWPTAAQTKYCLKGRGKCKVYSDSLVQRREGFSKVCKNLQL